MKRLQTDLENYFVEEFYINIKSNISTKNTLIIYISEPSEENYISYISSIEQYLLDEMKFDDYEIYGDYESTIEICKS